MQYKYCQNQNFEDFASGRVMIHKSGLSNFPVRLAQEIYCRCLSYLKNKDEVCIYDPCCGGGYLSASVGFLNPDSLRTIICSDFDSEALKIAKQNLDLLTMVGLESRLSQLQNLYAQFGKKSHSDAMESAKRLIDLLKEYDRIPETDIFQADILSKDVLQNRAFKADIVLTDVPYGNLVSWQGNKDEAMNGLLDNLIPILKSGSIVAVCSDKQQHISSDKYIRLERHQIGKRKFELFTSR